MSWKQIYDPIGDSIGLSALVALIPILYLLWALAIKRMKGYIAGLTTLVVALLLAVFVYGMPAGMAAMSILQGAVYGLLPIGWIIVASVFLYKLSVKTGQFDIIRDSIVSITEDRRLQALLIAFSFGAFLEGAAGFGAPVAISAALLVGLGFNPLYAAGLCLLANTAPVAFGAIGSPVIAIEGPTGMSAIEVSKVVGRQLPFLSVFVPFYLVVMMAGFKKAFEVIPAILVSGVSFAVTQFLVSNFLGPELPDIISALVSIIALTLFLKVWQPKTSFRFKSEMGQAEMAAGNAESIPALKSEGKKTYTFRQILKAWSPFIILTIVISVWGIPTVKKALIGQYEGTNGLLQGLNSVGGSLSFHPGVPGLNNLIIGGNGQPIEALFKLELLAAAGTAILISAIISKFVLKINWKSWFSTFIETLSELKFALLTIASVVGFAYVANASGMSITLGMTLAATGALFPFVSPILGWLGVFLTGSDTSANLLFSSLQKITANQVGMDPILAIAANSSGGVTGKMISPQSIAVACAAVGLAGKESDLFRFTLKHSIILLFIICCITYLQATVLSWMLP
ncbi:L-lactate permease [Fictibacillus fluitans]|uniref:L-lactate permease n=1 Tax=Fictibacillus fluitans TaxID=3058422 RepID=A0ABT8HQK6_9BACL|nr:lactate permease LctP family transporter [Fictibacillus sp. NE201]MDN4523042.1 lactate permease LctP family transporter [Fictibacillus sp. NE201]